MAAVKRQLFKADQEDGLSLLSGSLSQASAQRAAFVVLFAFAVHLVLFTCGIHLVSFTYTTGGSILDANAVAGSVLWLVGIIAGPFSVGLALIVLGQTRHKLGVLVASSLAAALTASSAALALWAFAVLVQPWNTWASPQPDTLRQFFGGLLFAAYIPVTIMAGIVTVQLAWAKQERSLPRTGMARLPMRPHQPESLGSNWRGLVYGAGVTAAVFAFTTVLSPVWNYSSTSYFGATSTYSWIVGVSWVVDSPAGPGLIIPKIYTDTVVYFSIVGSWIVLGAIGNYVPACRRALHKRCSVLSTVWTALGLPVYRKLVSYSLYPQGMTYGEVYLLSSFVGLFCYWFWYWSTGYPRVFNEARNDGDTHVSMHGYARVMGHMTTLCMSFLTFPVARNSVWESVFGVPFDRAVKYHRALGTLTWIAITAHAMLWWVKWLLDGSLLLNMLTINNLQVSNPVGGLCPLGGDCVHADNFTVPIVELAWLLLTGALFAAVFARRSSYELFLYTHVAALFFMIAALVHAWSHWYYTAIGLILLAFDKVMRTVGASRPVTVLSLSHAAGVTRLVLDRKSMGEEGHYAGQYAWLNIPGLSPFQWHPFTISSSPQAAKAGGIVEFHIKSMGSGTWTGQLAALAMAWQDRKGGEVEGQVTQVLSPADLCVSLDGPYGRAGRYYESKVLVLVAGGIGVTPTHAIAQDLLLRARAAMDAGLSLQDENCPISSPLGRLRRVHFVWTMRDASLAEEFAPTLLALSEIGTKVAGLSDMFHLHLHLTHAQAKERQHVVHRDELARSLLSAEQGAASAQSPTPVEAGWITPEESRAVRALLQNGRPDVESIFREAASAADPSYAAEHHHHHSKVDLSTLVTAFVCGPEALIERTYQLASSHGMGFHSEVFHF